MHHCVHAFAKFTRRCLAGALLVFATQVPAQLADDTMIDVVRSFIPHACRGDTERKLRVSPTDLQNTHGLAAPRVSSRKLLTGLQAQFSYVDFRVTVTRIAPNGHLQHVSVQYDSLPDGKPHILALGNFRCALHAARRLHYDASGKLQFLEFYGVDFAETGKRDSLNPPVPAGNNPDKSGIAIAVIDTGINYLLPDIRARIARDSTGSALGYDYWDLDNRPFDFHPVKSAFAPERHGTKIASILLAEAPVARLVPYRYPRPHMERMAALVQDAAASGAKIVNVSLVSYNRREWQSFAAAAALHPEILFVAAAGNQRHNIDRQPAYPASLALDNLITVTAARDDGRLGLGVNFGPNTVDIMVPAHNIEVTDFHGDRKRVSGSSYAAARVSAFSVCLLHAHPDWTAADLKAELIARAAKHQVPKYVAHGFISNAALAANGNCQPHEVASVTF